MKRFISIFTAAIALSAVLFTTACQTTNNIPDLVVNKDVYFQTEDHAFNQELLIPEDTFIETMRSEVEPYLDARMQSGTITCTSEDTIHYEAFTCDGEANGTVVIFHGFCEYTKKFNEQTYYFLMNGYNVVRFDHQGHGYSIRFVKNLSKVHTEHFDNYVNDADEIIQQIAVPLSNGKPLYLYAHSMGGGIGAAYMEKHPQTFTKAVLNCPMLELNSGKLSENVSVIICRIMRLFGQSSAYIPGNEDFKIDPNYLQEETSCGPTVSSVRRLYFAQFRLDHPEYQTNGATYGWTDESITATKRIRAKKNAKKLQTPILMFQSGNDAWVRPKGQYMLRNNSETVVLAFYPDVEHAIYSSKNEYLFEYYDMIFNWFEN